MKNISGITKRLYKALNNLIADNGDVDIENAIFHLCAVVESTAKERYPNIRGSRNRFLQYMQDIQSDLLYVWSNGINIYIDGLHESKTGENSSLGEILYNIRCCNYHDPEELKKYIDFSGEHGALSANKIGRKYAYSLFLILLSDEKNSERIDKSVFESFGKLIKNGKEHKLIEFIGNRKRLLELHNK